MAKNTMHASASSSATEDTKSSHTRWAEAGAEYGNWQATSRPPTVSQRNAARSARRHPSHTASTRLANRPKASNM
jgi:hypothetical protein